VKSEEISFRTVSLFGYLGLNLIHILGHHTLHFVIALIIFVTEPAHHHVVSINEIPSFPSIVQPGGVIVNNLDVRIKLAQDMGLGWGAKKTTRIKTRREKRK
jgi:hypothetical protein